MHNVSKNGEAHINLEGVSLRFFKNDMVPGLKHYLLGALSRKRAKAASRDFWALKNIDLKIVEGERLGIIGANGSGKSTLLKVISRIFTPQKGKIDVMGRIAPLIEIGAGFHPELTGRENIFLNGSILGVSKRELEPRVESIIAFSEMSEFIDTPLKYYSTGMHLRLAFTVATEVPPDILILDELYAGGDFRFITKASQRLEKFVDDSKILILVAHEMEYIRRFCNRVLVLEHGRIVKDAGPEESIDYYLNASQSPIEKLNLPQEESPCL